MQVADAIHGHVGNGSCADDQLAPWLDVSPKSSGYRLRVSAARLFELIESTAPGIHRLSALGRKVVDREQRERAKAESFLRVPLFDAAYERFRGSALPPAAALEREFAQLGVAAKQTAKARSSFERSAKEAGYFNEGEDRLVKPGFAVSEAPSTSLPTVEEDDRLQRRVSGSGNGGGGTRHPLIEGLLLTLPRPMEEWPVDKRVAWLEAAAKCFALIYEGEGEITIKGQKDPAKTAGEIS